VIKSKRKIWVGQAVHKVRNAYKILVRKPEGKRSLRRSSHNWENNIKMDLWEAGWEDVD